MRSVEEISIDGLRKVVFTEVIPKSTKCEFFEGDNCLIQFTVKENVFNLSQNTLNKRKYIKFGDTFLKDGVDNCDLRVFLDIINCDKYRINLKFSDVMSVSIYSSKFVNIILSSSISISFNLSFHIWSCECGTFKFYKQASFKDLLNYFDWHCVSIHKNRNSDYNSFEYDGVTFMGYSDILHNFNTMYYLDKVNFFNTGKLFKENAFNNKSNELLFAKVKTLKKMILIEHIEEDLSIKYKLI